MSESVFGVVYPLAKKYIVRILKGKRNIYAKYQPHRTQVTRVGPGTKVIFYETKGSKSLIGEAVVRQVDFMIPDEALKMFGGRLFIDREELERYAGRFPTNREKKPLMILDLDSPRLYEKPVRWSLGMTMAGRYISEEEYNQFVGLKV